MKPRPTTSRKTTCPRCGYDLSGAIDAWTNSCPLTGVCSECGLQLEWPRVLNPKLTTPPWSFEHAIARHPRRLLATAARTLIPLRFWRQLRMEHEIRPRRLSILAAIMLLLGHLACALAQGWEMYLMASGPWGAWTGAYDEWHAAARAALWPYGGERSGYSGLFTAAFAGAALTLTLSAPLAMLLLPDTFKLARVRQMHILRGGACGLCGAAAVIVVAMVIQMIAAESRAANWGNNPSLATMAVGAVALAGLGWYVAWWWLFTHTYLQLPRAWLVAIIILFIAMLAAFTVVDHIETGNAW